MVFRNRDAAAIALYQALRDLELENPLFLGIPAGGVPIGVALSRRFGADFDLALVRKLSHPADPELAIGAVSEDGDIILGTVIDEYGISEDEADEDAANEIDRLRKLRMDYMGASSLPILDGRTVVIVDDGVATGATAVTAVRMAQRSPIARLIVATPVTSSSARELLESEGAEVCAVQTLEDFTSISEHYEDFTPVTDEQVKDLLALARQPLS